ncbi:hypothetical protein R1flu_022079 [Riccia fluitans]|uniref:Uncharacterized protein n=1 Tax=Riccia fluitans TaxID=41844 RepID=A0ABD1ZSM0_9MARC
MPGSSGCRGSVEEISGLDQAMSTGDLHHHINVLLNKEKVLDSRMKLLMSLASGSSSRPQNFRAVTDALQTCWEEQRYNDTEAVEWRICIIQAAGITKGPVKELTKSLVWLGTKATCWFVEIASGDSQGRFSERELPAGCLLKIHTAVTSLISSLLERMLDTYATAELLLPDETLGPLIKNFISSAFAFVKFVYFSFVTSDGESLKKRCQEVLNLTSRLVYTFRRHIVGHPRGRIDMNSIEKLEDIAEKFPEVWLKQGFPLKLVSSSITSLVELGGLSTKGGAGSLGLMNISWKSVAALLLREEGCDFLASEVDVTPILTALLRHAVQALKVPIQTFLSSSESGERDARRLCIPVKFFLQIAERIASLFPYKAIMASSSIALSLSQILASLLLQYGVARRADLQVFSELIVPSTLDISHHLLRARNVEEEKKIELLRYITCDNDDLWNSHSIADLDGGHEQSEVLDELFNDKLNGLGLLKIGRLALFVSILQVSSHFSNRLLSELTLKLDWLLEGILEQGVYVGLTQAKLLPMWTTEGKVTWKHQLVFTWISNSLQTFAGVVAKDDGVWTEFQHFLFENVLHPCAMCRELVLTLWCYIIRQSDPDFAHKHIEMLFSLLEDMVSQKVELTVARRLARALCVLLEEAPETEAAFVYAVVFRHDPFSSESASNLATTLLEEGYSFSLLSEKNRKAYKELLISFCITSGKSLVDRLKEGRVTLSFHCQKQALVCLQLLLRESAFREEEVEDMLLQETLFITQELLRLSTQGVDAPTYFTSGEILSHALQLLTHVKHLPSSPSIDKLLPKLHESCTFISQNTRGKELKHSLPLFLASLGETTMTEDEENPSLRALRGLYHIPLREKHWALVHTGMESFSHFAVRTSYPDLSRFVPEDATVARKTGVGNTTEDAFMSALRSYIETEPAQQSLIPSDEELKLLRNEGALLYKMKDGVGAKDRNDVVEIHTDRVNGVMADIELAFDMTRTSIDSLKRKIPTWLASSSPHELQIIRTRFAELKEEVGALQQLLCSRPKTRQTRLNFV